MPALTDSIMSSLDKLFEEIESATDFKSKSMSLSKAKYFMLNEMTKETLREFFVANEDNFKNLFLLNIWTPSLEDQVTTEFLEPYEIVESIFRLFESLMDLLVNFKSQLVYLLNQNKDEKVKHTCVKKLTDLANSLG